MLSKQDRAMRAAYQDWAKYYRRLGEHWLHGEALRLARQCYR